MHAKREQIVRVRKFRLFEDWAEGQLVDQKRRVSKKVKTKTSKQSHTRVDSRPKERPRDAKRHANANISTRPYVVRDQAEGKSFLSS
jgi:hypothetical protein